MRTILITCCVIVVALIAGVYFSLREANHYGSKFNNAPKAQVLDLLERPSEFIGKPVTLEGKVEDQCPTSGCFFYLHAGNKKLRIELGDIAQKIPRKVGDPVTVEGQLVPFGQSYQFLGTAAEFH